MIYNNSSRTVFATDIYLKQIFPFGSYHYDGFDDHSSKHQAESIASQWNHWCERVNFASLGSINN